MYIKISCLRGHRVEPSDASIRGDRLRVLYLGFDVGYINPTRQQFVEALRSACDLTLFGPGYVPHRVFARGIAAFYEESGPFDVVFGDEFSLLRPGMVSEERKYDHCFYYHASRFDPLLIHKGTEYFTFLKNYRGVRVISLLQSDYYNFSEAYESMLEEVADYVVCWGREFLLRRAQISAQLVKGMALNRQIHQAWTERYCDFVTRNMHRVLSTPHFIGSGEMSARPLANRRREWSVVGADYDSRVFARQQLDDAGLTRTGKCIPYIYAAAARVRFHPYNKYWAIDFLNWIFFKAMRDARYGFTCGSVMRWPIRKYFEIPGSGAVLVAERCNGWAALGFADGANAVCCEASDILEAHRWLAQHPDRAQAIAKAGFKLVLERHTTQARGEQIVESLRRILAGRFEGSFWADGHLRFHSPKPPASGGH